VTQANYILYDERQGCDLRVNAKQKRRWAWLAALIAIVAMSPAVRALPDTAPASEVESRVPMPAGLQNVADRTRDLGSSRAASGPSQASRWVQVPRLAGRLTARDIGVVINTADPYSVEVGEYYLRSRGLTPSQVLRVNLPVRGVLNTDEFNGLADAIAARFGASIQALALAWVAPYAVNCNSITGALALGYDGSLCAHTCASSKASPYFNASTLQPFSDLKLRPSMLLAAGSVAGAKAMIDRGVAADRSLGLRGGLPVNAYFVKTTDKARSTRSALFPPAGTLRRVSVEVHVESTQTIENVTRLLIYQTGLTHVDKLDTLKWVPGALADHLTSFGGQLLGGSGQMSILE
jgi:uncharacterized protein (TIGR03790 family)